MWTLLRDRRLNEMKFRRQVPIGRYVADFASYYARLVVELDGMRHGESVQDKIRDAEIRGRGFEVLRIWNSDLFLHRDRVLDTIVLTALGRIGGDDARC